MCTEESVSDMMLSNPNTHQKMGICWYKAIVLVWRKRKPNCVPV